MITIGSISINIRRFTTFLKTLPKGNYTTFQLLQRYMNYHNVNKGVPAGSSWNANFGKVLMKYSGIPSSILAPVTSRQPVTIQGNFTHTASWRII